MILLLSSDVLFRSKIEAAALRAGHRVTTRATESADVEPPAEPWQLVMIDLDEASDPVRVVTELRTRFPATPLVAYGSHVDRQRQQQAIAAGCHVVLPRSAFVQQLPQLLTRAQQIV